MQKKTDRTKNYMSQVVAPGEKYAVNIIDAEKTFLGTARLNVSVMGLLSPSNDHFWYQKKTRNSISSCSLAIFLGQKTRNVRLIGTRNCAYRNLIWVAHRKAYLYSREMEGFHHFSDFEKLIRIVDLIICGIWEMFQPIIELKLSTAFRSNSNNTQSLDSS